MGSLLNPSVESYCNLLTGSERFQPPKRIRAQIMVLEICPPDLDRICISWTNSRPQGGGAYSCHAGICL